MRLLDLKYEAFGLDINDSSLKIVKLKKKRNGFDLVSFNEAKIWPDIIENGIIKNEASLVKIIKSALDEVKGKKIKTKYVVASLPEDKAFLQVVQMPKMSKKELELAVPIEAENYIPMPLSEVYLDFYVIPQVKDYLNRLEVLIVATPQKIVDSYVACFKKAGLVPIILETESLAIARALIKDEDNSSPLILIDFGEDNTDFIVYSGNSIRFTCSIPISSRSLTKAVSESLIIDFHEAERLKINYGLSGRKTSAKSLRASQIMTPILEELVVQIKKYLNFYYNHSSYEYLLPNGKFEKILLCGGGAELNGMVDFLSKKLETRVDRGNPLVNLLLKKSKQIMNKDLISFTTAIGLALRQADDVENL